MTKELRVKADAVKGDPLWDCANEVSRLRERLEKAEAVVEAARTIRATLDGEGRCVYCFPHRDEGVQARTCHHTTASGTQQFIRALTAYDESTP